MNLTFLPNPVTKPPVVQLSIPTVDFWADVEILSGIIRSYWAEKRLLAKAISNDGLEAKVLTETGKEFGTFKVAYGKCDCPDCKGEYIVIQHNLPAESAAEIFNNLKNRFSMISITQESIEH